MLRSFVRVSARISRLVRADLAKQYDQLICNAESRCVHIEIEAYIHSRALFLSPVSFLLHTYLDIEECTRYKDDLICAVLEVWNPTQINVKLANHHAESKRRSVIFFLYRLTLQCHFINIEHDGRTG